MRAGTLNSRVMIQRRASGVDDWGQPLPEAWVNLRPLWADIKHQTGSQAIKADAPVSTARASIRIRYCLGIDAGMRVVYRATVYDIQAVLPDEQKREYVDLVCEATK